MNDVQFGAVIWIQPIKKQYSLVIVNGYSRNNLYGAKYVFIQTLKELEKCSDTPREISFV